MSETAVDTLSKLKEIITVKYGAEAGKLIGVAVSYASKAGVQNSTFKPDENGFVSSILPRTGTLQAMPNA